MKIQSIGALAALLLVMASGARAATVWNWSFASEAGQFVTDGAGDYAVGTYTLQDFSVMASGVGATIGSLSTGEYATGWIGTREDFTFTWDGSAVTSWFHTGSNTFDWWAFEDVPSPGYGYGFATTADTPPINDPTSAVYVLPGITPVHFTSGTLSVTPVPIPATLWLFGAALGYLAGLGHGKTGVPSDKRKIQLLD